jgi:iron uptake system component EfeO
MSRLLPSLAVVAAGALSLAACGGSATTAGSDSKSTHIKVTLTSSGDCTYSATSAPAGPITFDISNTGATGLSEFEVMTGQRIIGERENVVPGLPAGTFTLTLDGGSYTLYCPGANTEKTTLTVTGKAAAKASGSAADLLAQGASEYQAYVQTQVDGMVTAVGRLHEAVESGDVAAAQKAYAEARPFYEKIESDVEGFLLPGTATGDNRGNLDYLIDMRASNLDPAVGWSGFHAVERDLFQAKRITKQTETYAHDLDTNVQKLASVAKTLTFKPEDLANGAAGLLEEVQKNKVTGEEEAFSHLDLVDLSSNVEGAQQAFEALKPGLVKINPTLSAQIEQRFARVEALLDTLRSKDAIGGYLTYTPEVRAADSGRISQAIQALQDPLSQLAEKVATA